MTTAAVRVAEVRATTAEAGKTTIDLSVVRLRRVGATASRSAHVVLAGGPGDSGVDQVLELARQGGARIASLMDGDVIGIDQCGSGRSVPNLFKLGRITLAPRERIDLEATFSLAVHSTRVPRPGRHAVDVVVNGCAIRAGAFSVSKT